jgi:hypothetical protein
LEIAEIKLLPTKLKVKFVLTAAFATIASPDSLEAFQLVST